MKTMPLFSLTEGIVTRKVMLHAEKYSHIETNVHTELKAKNVNFTTRNYNGRERERERKKTHKIHNNYLRNTCT